jgi:hypothetical protein
MGLGRATNDFVMATGVDTAIAVLVGLSFSRQGHCYSRRLERGSAARVTAASSTNKDAVGD